MKGRRPFLSLGLIFLFLGSTLAQSNLDEGIALYQSKEFERGSQTLIEATKLDNKDAVAWLYLGASYLQMGKEKDALKAFRKGKVRKKDELGGNAYRAEIIERPRPRYTDLARANKTTGTVRLAVELKADGSIGFVFVIQALPNGLTEYSIAAARAIKFRPPLKQNRPVTTIELIENVFEIR